MTYIKKLVMHGFKSFVKKTEVPFVENGINVILGSNGSGKSNITDAICFVLGRLSIKSMRAAKAKNLIFMGNKHLPPLRQASVEILFDNSDKSFSFDKKEVSIKRIIKKDGSSTYKIDDKTHTRQEVLFLLSQAGIDPNGFNIILQGEIQNFVRMHSEARRKIIEEVAGISVYELRKEKSLKELEKTDEKLKEVIAILKERSSYLNNLEKERQQALRFKKLEKDVKIFKASIINCDLETNQKEITKIENDINKKLSEIEKAKKEVEDIKINIEKLQTKVLFIDKKIKDSSGFEQEKLNREIADIRAELAGLNVRLEGFDRKSDELNSNNNDLNDAIKEAEESIKNLQKESPESLDKSKKELDEKKNLLEKLEKQREKFYILRSEIKSLQERILDKEELIKNYKSEQELLIRQTYSLNNELFDKSTTGLAVQKLYKSLTEKKALLESVIKEEKELEKKTYFLDSEIEKDKKVLSSISSLDVCPVCKSKITKDHIHQISMEAKPKIEKLKKSLEESDKKLSHVYEKKDILIREIESLNLESSKRQSDLLKISSIEEKRDQIKYLEEKIQSTVSELNHLKKKKTILEKDFDKNSNIDHKVDTLRIEVQEASIRSKKNLSAEVAFKQREIDRMKISLKHVIKELGYVTSEKKELEKAISQKKKIFEKKKKQDEELSLKFEKLLLTREEIQKRIRDSEKEIFEKESVVLEFENRLNDTKVEKAKFLARAENLEMELLNFPDVVVIKGNRGVFENRLKKTQEILFKIGSVNLRSLEVYDSIKKEYDDIKEKVGILNTEKEGILKIIEQIDIKKKRVFIKTINSLNEIFSRNFSQLSIKGAVSLELENKIDPFHGGVGILVKTGKGKYFDVTSLSGGEQTIVALSLIFAIQEYSPYYFYVLDEIDAALDKRNSEKLGRLLRKHMEKGQYILITHNDEVITNATSLFGVTMNDGVSKIVSVKL